MYKHRIKLQNPVITRDAHGGFTPVQHNDMTIANWTDIASAQAYIEPLRGRQYFEAQQVNSEVTHKVKLRYCADVMADIKPKSTRLLYNNRAFKIETAYSPRELKREIELLCVEVV